MNKKILLSLALLSSTPVVGAPYLLDGTQVIDLTIANRGLTRLSVSKDPIQDIFAYPETIENHVQLHESGNVFIAGDGISEPFSLTLITRSGKAQDLSLKTTSKAPSPIVLETEPLKITETKINAWLGDFRKGFVPAGFKRIAVDQKFRRSEQLKAVPQRVWRNGDAWVTQYTVKSTLDEAISCTPEPFVSSEEAGIFTKSILNPGETTSLFIFSNSQQQVDPS